jgi:hypothetical protein
MNSHAILLCLVALVAFPALVFGAGTIFANTVITTTPIDTGVQFHDPLYAPVATVDNIKTDTFALLRQFQLYVGVPAITLNGGAGGVQLLGSLGANLDAGAANSISISSTSSVATSSSNLQFQAANTATFYSALGNINSNSGEFFEVLGRTVTVTAANNPSSLSTTGAINIQSINNAVTISADTVGLKHGTDVRFTSQISDVEIAGTFVNATGRVFTINAAHDAAIYSDHNVTLSATSTGTFAAENVEFTALKSLTANAASTLSVSGEQTVTLHGNAVALTGGTVNIGGNALEINGGFSVVKSTSVQISSNGATGNILVDAAQSILVQASSDVNLQPSTDGNIGTADSISTSLVADAVLKLSGVVVSSNGVSTSLSGKDITTTSTSSVSLYASGTSSIASTSGTTKFSAPNQRIISGPLSSISFASGGPTTITAGTLGFTAAGSASIGATNALSVASVGATFAAGNGFDATLKGDTTLLQATTGTAVFTSFQTTAHVVNDITIGGSAYTSTSNSASFSSVGDATFNPTGAFQISGPSSAVGFTVLGKNGTADMSSGGDITVSGQSFTINGGNADVLATSSVALSGSTELTVSSDTSQLVDTAILTLSASTQILTEASNINYNLQSALLSTGSVLIQAGNNVNLQSTNDFVVNAPAGQIAIDADGGLGFNSGSDMTFKGTNSAGIVADNDIRLEAGETVALRGTTSADISSTGDILLASGRDLLVSLGTLTLDADQDVALSAAGQLSVSSGDKFSMTGSSIAVKSGFQKTITVTSGDDTVITAAQEAPRQVTFSGQSTRVVAGGPLSISAKTMALGATDEILSASGDIFMVAGADLLTTTKRVSYSGTNLVEFVSGTDTVFQSGTDRYINGSLAQGIRLQAGQDVDVSSASDINLYATEDFVMAASADILIGAQSKLVVNVNRSISLVAQSDVDNSINIQSGGSVSLQSGPSYNIVASTGFDLIATAQNEMDFIGDGGNSAGCGIDLQVGSFSTTKFAASQLWGVIHGRKGVSISSTSPIPGSNSGDLAFTSTKDAFFHAEDGGLLVTANALSSRSKADSILVSSSSANGDIAITAIQASVLNNGKGVTLKAGNTVGVSTGQGVDIYATGGDIQLQTGAALLIDGARALNISAGSVSPPIAGALQFTSTSGPITAQADSEIRLVSKSTVSDAAGSGMAISGTTGVTLKTSNGYDLQANAAGGVAFTATKSSISLFAVGGDVKVDSNAASFALTSAKTASVSGTDGPVVISAGGVNGFATFESTNNAWQVMSTSGSVSIAANTEARISATNQLNVQSSSGSVLVATVRPVDDIVVSSTDISVSSSGVREKPEDHLSVSGNNVDMYATTSVQFDASAGGIFYIGNTTTPVIAVTATAVTLAAGDGMRVASDRQVRVAATTTSTFSGSTGLRLTSLDGIKFTATNPTPAEVLIQANNAVSSSSQSASLRAPGIITIDGGSAASFSSSGQRDGDGVFFDSQTTIYHKGVNKVQFVGATFDATRDVGAASFITGQFSLTNQAPSNSAQNDFDRSYIAMKSSTTTALLSAAALTLQSTASNGTISFTTTASQADMLLSAADVMQLTTTGATAASDISFQANVFQATTPLAITLTSNDPTGLHKANITVRANDNIVGTSNTKTVAITAGLGGATFETVDRPSQMQILSGTNSPVTVSSAGNLTLSTHDESLSDVTIRALGAGGVITFAATGGTSALLQIQALGGQAKFATTTSTITQTTATYAVDAQHGAYFAASTALTLKATTKNIQFRTNSSNSDINISSTGQFTADCTDAATCQFSAIASDGLSLTSSTGALSVAAQGSFIASATGKTTFVSTGLTTLTAADQLVVSATGFDETTGTGVGITGASAASSITFTSAKATTIKAVDEVAFMQLTTGGSFSLASSTKELTVAAQGNNGKILLHGNSGVTLTGTSVSMFAGSNVLLSGAKQLTLQSTSTLTVTTNAPGAAITIENDFTSAGPINFFGAVTAQPTKGAIVFSTDAESTSPITVSSSTTTSYAPTANTGVPLQVASDLGDISFTSASGALQMTGTGHLSFGASNIQVTAAMALTKVSSNTAVYSDEGVISLVNTAGTAYQINAVTTRTTGVGYGNDILFAAGGDMSFALTTVGTFTTLGDQGDINMHSAGVLSVAGNAVNLRGRGGVHFINEHGPSAAASGVSVSGSAINLHSWGLGHQVDFESDIDMRLSAATSVASTNFQGTLGFFSKTPSPLHTVARHTVDVCVAFSNDHPGRAGCRRDSGFNNASHAGVLQRLDEVLQAARLIMLQYGLVMTETLGTALAAP